MAEVGLVAESNEFPVAAAAAAASAEKKSKKRSGVGAASKMRKNTAIATHPTTQKMVDAAIKSLKERGGSSLPAIKKYITGTYKCDSQKLAPFIKKYLKAAVANGKLIRTKGKGASGSFKLSAVASKDAPTRSKMDTVSKKRKAKPTALAAKKKPKAAIAKKTSAEKKVTAGKDSATKKIDKKKVEKAKAKSIKKVGTKTKPAKTVAAKTSATKPKAPKAKSAVAIKPRKSNVAAKKAVTAKKTAAAGKK